MRNMEKVTIDRVATRKAVEAALEEARIYKQIGMKSRETRSTPSYEPRFHGLTNMIAKPVEDCALRNVDAEERMNQHLASVEEAIARLDQRQKEIIERRYLEREKQYDYLICYDLGMSDRTYRREKADAIYLLALMLKLSVPVVEGKA